MKKAEGERGGRDLILHRPQADVVSPEARRDVVTGTYVERRTGRLLGRVRAAVDDRRYGQPGAAGNRGPPVCRPVLEIAVACQVWGGPDAGPGAAESAGDAGCAVRAGLQAGVGLTKETVAADRRARITPALAIADGLRVTAPVPLHIGAGSQTVSASQRLQAPAPLHPVPLGPQLAACMSGQSPRGSCALSRRYRYSPSCCRRSGRSPRNPRCSRARSCRCLAGTPRCSGSGHHTCPSAAVLPRRRSAPRRRRPCRRSPCCRRRPLRRSPHSPRVRPFRRRRRDPRSPFRRCRRRSQHRRDPTRRQRPANETPPRPCTRHRRARPATPTPAAPPPGKSQGGATSGSVDQGASVMETSST